MLNQTSAQLGVNLAMVAHDRNIDLTPVAGSLMGVLTLAVKNAIGLTSSDSLSEAVDRLPSCIMSAASGGSEVLSSGVSSYNTSHHDSVMDNAIVEIAQLSAQHVNYARSVVYPKILQVEEAVRAALQNYDIKEAEDFFNVTYYRAPELFSSQLVESEVEPLQGQVRHPDVVNFGEVLASGFDPSVYFITGDEGIDAMIKQWIAQTGKDVVMSYLSPKSANFEYSLFGPHAMDYHMANFLLYRQLNLKQDLSLNLSLVRLLAVSAANRDYHASQVMVHLNMYRQAIERGVLLSPNTNVNFSYMSAVKFDVLVYDESFAQLSDSSDVMEKIYGALSANSRKELTVELIKTQGEELLRSWKTVRALYTSYLTTNRSQLLKSSLRLALGAVFAQIPDDEKDSPLADEARRHKSMQAANAYIHNLEASDAEDLYRVCLEVVARHMYGFSNAYFFLREMYEILEADDDLDPAEAAHAALVCYLTDFLMEQVSIGQRQI